MHKPTKYLVGTYDPKEKKHIIYMSLKPLVLMMQSMNIMTYIIYGMRIYQATW